ncbi:hypothetical protein OV203_42730 [Nannocystis sp. ILAH1]|uniref:hypothetical protein n=1 Tax=unclassified Nannocystis TaxID=2627009 RepID=UPI00226F7541|nr:MULTISPECIES: hypothetical protein [unclassified Nannocystis]MCY0993932.1 hypothetical protein [Nannocystis sp. ILAH1]MCY1066898.1 hypothetical protein [Nannocystis sp. RBIL2]
MAEDEALPGRKYLVWIWVAPSRSVIADVVGAIASDPARLERWLDAEARTALDFRVGLDLAGLQQGRDAQLRALFREALPDVTAATRGAIEAALARPGYLPMQPIGAAYVQEVATAIGENPRNRKPPTQAPAAGLLALRVLEAGGTVRVTPPWVEGPSVVSTATVRALLQALRGDPRLWAKWCNLCSIHRGWAKGFSSCAHEAAAALSESERPAVLAWLEEREWWSTPGSCALRGSVVLQTFTSEVTERALLRGL